MCADFLGLGLDVRHVFDEELDHDTGGPCVAVAAVEEPNASRFGPVGLQIRLQCATACRCFLRTSRAAQGWVLSESA